MDKDDHPTATITELEEKYFADLIEQVDFEAIALRAAALGERVFPLPPGKKAARMANWPDVATTDADQIKRWAAASPHANCAVVATPDRDWFLDDDSGTLEGRYHDETGRTFPTTRTIRTGRRNGNAKHYVFRQNAASRAMGNLSCAGIFDAQVGVSSSGAVAAKYVVGAGSLHPSGHFYEAAIEGPIAEAPVELIAWLIDLSGSTRPPSSDATEDEIEIVREGQGRNNYLTSIAGKLRRNGLSQRAILAALTEHNKEHCRPPLPIKEVRAIANSIGKKETGEESPTAYVDATIRNLRYLPGTRTARYTVEVNGVDVGPLSTKELFTFSLFQMRVADALGILLQPRTKPQWDCVIAELMRTRTLSDAPDNATEAGMIFEGMRRFFDRIEYAKSRDDILRHLPVEYGKYIAFLVEDAQTFLKNHKDIRIDNADLFTILHDRGCKPGSMRLREKVIKPWLFPKESLDPRDEHNEKASLPDFLADEEPHDNDDDDMDCDGRIAGEEPRRKDHYGL